MPRDFDIEDLVSLHDEAVLGEVQILNVNLNGVWANDVTFQGCEFADVDISASQLERLRLSDVTIARANLANLKAPGAAWRRVTFEGCRLTGLELLSADLRDVSFKDCRIDLAAFATSKLERVLFADCVLDQTEFSDTQLEHAAFHDCQLTGTDMRGARMRHCELRRCNLEQLQGIGNLRGAALEWPVIIELAGVFAATLGIDVLDRD